MAPIVKKGSKPVQKFKKFTKKISKPTTSEKKILKSGPKKVIRPPTQKTAGTSQAANQDSSNSKSDDFKTIDLPWPTGLVKNDNADEDDAPVAKRPRKSEAQVIATSKKAFAQLDSKIDRQRLAELAASKSDDEDDDDNMAPLLNTASGKKRAIFKPMDSDSDGGESDSDENDDAEDDEAVDSEEEDDNNVQEKLQNMTIAEIKKLKDKLGLKIFNKMYFENGTEEPAKQNTASDDEDNEKDATDSDEEAPNEEGSSKKSRHAPREMSSKRPVSVYRQIDPNAVNYERRRIDPRFDRKAGEFNESEFRRDYKFVDEMALNDIKRLKTEMKEHRKRGDINRANTIRERIRQLENRQTAVEERDLWRQTTREFHETNIDRMNRGLKPKFASNTALKAKFVEKKLDRIEKTGNITKYLKNKERRDNKKKLM